MPMLYSDTMGLCTDFLDIFHGLPQFNFFFVGSQIENILKKTDGTTKHFQLCKVLIECRYASWNSPDFMNKLVRPCWKQLQLSVPPCQSSGFLVNADPVLLQSRSFRRGGYQALRRAGVDKTIRDFMMRWTERKTNNTNQESYDDLTAEDTVNASARI